MRLVIRNSRVIDPATGFDEITDIVCDYGVISHIGEYKDSPDDCSLLDASGLITAPGLVDMHCHLRDPGYEYKEDIRSGTVSAAAGGITSAACMPNTNPVCDNADTVRYILDKAARLSPIRVFPIGAVTLGQRGVEPAPLEAMRSAGAVAFSDDGMPVMDNNIMKAAMHRAAEMGTVIISHCEDFWFNDHSSVSADSYGLTGCGIKIETSEESMAARDISLSLRTGAPVHIAHVSTRNTIDLVRYAKSMGAPVTCETCPHYFSLTSDVIADKGTLAKMNPPLRKASDLKAVISGLADGTIDAIATDHAPHSADEKSLPFDSAPNGIVGFETLLPVSLTVLYHGGYMSLSEVLRRLTCSPADILRIEAGRISTGKPADLVLFSPDEEWIPDPDRFLSKGKSSPFGGMKLKGRVKYTVSAGRIIYTAE